MRIAYSITLSILLTASPAPAESPRQMIAQTIEQSLPATHVYYVHYANPTLPLGYYYATPYWAYAWHMPYVPCGYGYGWPSYYWSSFYWPNYSCCGYYWPGHYWSYWPAYYYWPAYGWPWHTYYSHFPIAEHRFALPQQRSIVDLDDESLYSEGLAAFWNRDYASSLTFLNAALERNRYDARTWYFKALAERANGDWNAGAEAARRGAALELLGTVDRHQLSTALERIQGDSRQFLTSARTLDLTAAKAQQIADLPVKPSREIVRK